MKEIKYKREIKIGVLAALSFFLLFFGFNYLKGINIFSPTNAYFGRFDHLHGLEEQAAVYIRGHKVGAVHAIDYDFTNDSAFTVEIAINSDIALPQGTRMALVADGLLGGTAVELQFPVSGERLAMSDEQPLAHGAYLPTTYVPGLVESLQGELLAHVNQAVMDVDSLVAQLQSQLEGDHLHATLENVDRVSGDLTAVSADLKHMMAYQVPGIVHNADTAVANLNAIVADLQQADLAATVARVDTAVDGVNALLIDVRSQEGTLGQLIYNQGLYHHIDATVQSADSLLTDIKARPKRYVHFSLFGRKKDK
ncbi:MAG: MCE family protein [Paludibacteraceae bacterium]|nr:MCE family protein [Paludibacteraceae bacterium]